MEFQARDFSERRTPPAVGAPEKLVTPGTERTSPAKPPGTNAKEGSSIFAFKILVKPPVMPTERLKPKRAAFTTAALKRCCAWMVTTWRRETVLESSSLKLSGWTVLELSRM